MKQVSKVYWSGMAIALIFVVWGVVFPENVTMVMENTKAFLLDRFGFI